MHMAVIGTLAGSLCWCNKFHKYWKCMFQLLLAQIWQLWKWQVFFPLPSNIIVLGGWTGAKLLLNEGSHTLAAVRSVWFPVCQIIHLALKCSNLLCSECCRFFLCFCLFGLCCWSFLVFSCLKIRQCLSKDQVNNEWMKERMNERTNAKPKNKVSPSYNRMSWVYRGYDSCCQ